MEAQDESGWSPLHRAAANTENPAVIDTLLAAGSDLAARDENDWTPLHSAALLNPNPAVIEVLVAAGADVNAPSDAPEAETLDGSPLHLAAARNAPAVIEVLLTAGANPRALWGDNGDTLLHLAAAENDEPAVIDTLLALGLDLEARDRNGGTPLHGAAEPAVIEALIAAGANPNARLRNGRTPLHLWRDKEEIEALVAGGANLEARDDWGETPLHAAAGRYLQNTESIQALVAAGANLEARDEKGDTPLHHAARYDGTEFLAGRAIESLLDAGANPMARNAAGESPWDVAQANDMVRDTDGYWRLNDARFNAPRQESRRPVPQPNRRQAATPQRSARRGPACEIPGYPALSNLQNLGVSWCGPRVGFQRRAFALQAAGAWCAIDGGSSSTLDQINARHQEINAACDALDALAAQGGSSCRCPAGYRP